MSNITIKNPVPENIILQDLKSLSYLSGGEEYIESLYESYLKNPENILPDWRRYFDEINQDKLTTANHSPVSADISYESIREYFKQRGRQKKVLTCQDADAHNAVSAGAQQAQQGAVKDLINAYRRLGHLNANLDPLGLNPLPFVPELNPENYNVNLISGDDLAKDFLAGQGGENKTLTLNDLIQQLKQIYCQTIGAEFLHIQFQDEVCWIQQYLENSINRPVINLKKQERILSCLTAAEGLEKYLGTKYAGQKRFSLEGADSLIVLLDTLIQQAGNHEIQEAVIGMAHRGRLNVLVNVLGKSPQELFDAFEGKVQDDNHSGDVKYHLGFSSDVDTDKNPIHLALAFNPSHLEIVSPVVTGSVRARQQRMGLDKRKAILSVQIHGDAAFAGQGVVMETFSLSQTQGYGTGGTIHIVINNQVGFTTDPVNARSTYYCTDIAKMIQAPIFHVNADDPEAVLFVTRLALDYRMLFGKDIVIDLICYRRHGHNEADEPSATQPVMYQKIRIQPSVRKIYAEQLMRAQNITLEYADKLVDNYRAALDKGENFLVPLLKSDSANTLHSSIDWSPYLQQTLDQKINTGFDLAELKKLGQLINTVPDDFTLQPQVAKVIQDNYKMAQGDLPINWGFAENLAYAVLLTEKFNIRISGQDSGRGTFAHRHALWHDYKTGSLYTPLKQISPHFEIIDSILSEAGVVAFEYGYSSSAPETLVIWEAQFGDFANGAQVVIDQFISSGEQKWGRLSGLTLLLPHGYEGMGPEHSSARLERYLQLCAQENMQVCIPTTPAQMFHLLRRQMLRKVRKPLIVMTPKSLLRHKLAVSSLEDLSSGEFQCVMPDALPDDFKLIKQLIFCSGKVYYDLLEYRQSQKINSVALIRLEQLYPFRENEIKIFLKKNYPAVKNIIWCQEEPQNQGAWSYIKPLLGDCLIKSQTLRYAGRPAAASTATGSAKKHQQEQRALVEQAFSL